MSGSKLFKIMKRVEWGGTIKALHDIYQHCQIIDNNLTLLTTEKKPEMDTFWSPSSEGFQTWGR